MVEETRFPERQCYHDVNLGEAETSIRASLRDAARSVIAVGHYLKVIRDKELYREAGYENVWDYAADTFGFSKSTASRYMARNDKFSVGGNSPVLAEEFREYSKAQLQEMLSLDAEQMDSVTPDMTVREIRELRRPKEIPYYEIPGQMSLSDFPELEAEQESDETVTQEANRTDSSDTASFTVTAEDLIGEMQEDRVAASQQMNAADKQQEIEENAAQKQRAEPQDSMTIRGFIKYWKEACPDDFNLTLRAMRAGKDAGEKAKSIQRALAPHDFHGVSCSEYSFEFYSFSGGMDWMVDGRKIHLKYGRLANELLCMYDPYMSQFDAPTVSTTDEPESSELCSITEDSENQEDVVPENCEEGDEITDLQLLKDMLERKKRLLATNLAIPGIDVLDEHIRKQKIEVAALASMLCDLENTIGPEESVDEKPEQPELPLLRNNDQRAAFVDAYETWPLWIETEKTGERYYRYDLPDGTSFVVKTYHSMLYDYKAGVGMRYKEGYGANEQYILKPGKFFRDCSANRSAMIEKLKELQKADKENSRQLPIT